MTNSIDKRLNRLEERVVTKYPPVFCFIDDPEGVERCRRENPNALIIHHVIVDPPKPVRPHPAPY